ncbi:MAG: hypothetical protein KN64_13150 [Sulfurovum sp. AS07-7]|nr:MAG: hypothetical protein KN64_13150 [Sulfurovum sp. AS07-7]
MKKLLFLLTIIITTFLSCYGTKEQSTTIDYYHWKQNYEVNSSSLIKPSFIKIIDIGYDYAREDLDIKFTNFKTSPSFKITPVVYIDNEALISSDEKKMASSILELLQKSSKQNNFAYDTIQIDCDWNAKSRYKYFNLLKIIKSESKKIISATIRLHQIANASQTGIPDVDRGVLMYYNMSDFKDMDTKNYILDNSIASQYHKNFDTYPLELDLALPLYSQATIIRFGKVVGLIEGVRIAKLDKDMFVEIEKNIYEAKKEHYLKGRLLYKGDRIRIDSVEISELKKSVDELKKVMKAPKNIIFYQWENRAFYNEYELKKLW